MEKLSYLERNNMIKVLSDKLRKLVEANDILESIQPITGVLQAVGFPYNIVKKKNSDGYVFKLTVPFVLNFVMGGAVFMWCMYKFQTRENTAVVDTVIHGWLFKYGDRINLYSNCWILTIFYLLSTFRDYKGFPKIALILCDIENLWKSLGINKNYHRMKVLTTVVIISQSSVPWSQVILGVVQMSSWKESLNYFEIYPMYMPGFLFTVLLTSYGVFTFQGTNINFSIMSSELELIYKKRLLDKSEAKALFLGADSTKLRQNLLLKELESSSRDEVVSERLTQYWKIYDRICDYTDSVNETFSFKVVVIFAMSFVSMVFYLFITLSSVGWMAKGGERAYFIFTYALGQSVLQFVHTFFTIRFIHNCQASVSLILFKNIAFVSVLSCIFFFKIYLI